MKTQLNAIDHSLILRAGVSLLVTASLVLYGASAQAEKPEGAGNGKVKMHGQEDGQGNGKRHDKGRGKGQDYEGRQGDRQQVQSSGGTRINISVGGYFQPQQRTAVQAYYGPILQSGRCPPGLAKKNNGCMPPGQAKAYTLGRPLPSQVIYYDVPPSVSLQIGLPPAGHRYVRVAADILLIAVGTGMVVDAIQDLGGM